MTHRLSVFAVVILGAAALFAAPAFADLDAEPVSVPAGSTTTVSFNMEHGCDGSPATKLEMKIPTGVTIMSIPAKRGWTSTKGSGTVTWTGGPQPADEETAFSLEIKVSDSPGTDLIFAAVETCEEGSIGWITEPVEGQARPEHPAAVIKVTAAGTAAVTSKADTQHTDDHEHADDAKNDGHHDDDAKDSGHDDDPKDSEHDDDSNTGLIVGVGVAAIVVVGAVATVLVRRKR